MTTTYENGLIKWKMEVNENEIYYLPIAIFITAYARNVLVSAIQVKERHLFYVVILIAYIVLKDCLKGISYW